VQMSVCVYNVIDTDYDDITMICDYYHHNYF